MGPSSGGHPLGLGMATVIGRRNLFFLLMGVELMLNAVNLSFVGFSRVHSGVASLEGQIVPLFSIALAAAEACIALAMVISSSVFVAPSTLTPTRR